MEALVYLANHNLLHIPWKRWPADESVLTPPLTISESDRFNLYQLIYTTVFQMQTVRRSPQTSPMQVPFS